jgi:hypothetical protein
VTDLTKIMFENLTPSERMQLAALAQQEEFQALKKLFDLACKAAGDDVMKVDPEDDKYERKVAARQMRARNINEFCECIRKNFLANVMIANEAKERDNAGKPAAN